MARKLAFRFGGALCTVVALFMALFTYVCAMLTEPTDVNGLLMTLLGAVSTFAYARVAVHLFTERRI